MSNSSEASPVKPRMRCLYVVYAVLPDVAFGCGLTPDIHWPASATRCWIP